MNDTHIITRPADPCGTDAEILAAVELLRGSASDRHHSLAGQRSLTHLYGRYAAPLRAAGHRLVGDEALDVVHEVFLDLPRLLQQYRGNGLLPWLRRIVVTRCLMRLRRRRRFVDGDVPKDAAHSEEPSHQVERDVLLRAALARLSAPLREVVVMKYFLSLSHEEIGALLEISSTASELRLFRAMRLLREILGATGRASRHVA